ncbi:MAG: hypothetical protein QXQ48_02985 [Nitrososphaerota archaeon]
MTPTELVPLGEVFRILQRLAVLKGGTLPELSETVYTGDGRAIGYVSDIFGKIDSFYIVVRLTSDDVEVKLGERLYLKGKTGLPSNLVTS